MKFASLTDLSLERIKIVDGGARLFARLVSPASCPLLQRLRVARLRFPNFSEASRLELKLSCSRSCGWRTSTWWRWS
jgi:hypothetical protein